MKGDRADAMPHLQSAIGIHPANEDCRIRLAQSFAKLGRIKEAIAVLEAAPADTEGRVHYVLARVLPAGGRRARRCSARSSSFKHVKRRSRPKFRKTRTDRNMSTESRRAHTMRMDMPPSMIRSVPVTNSFSASIRSA